MPQPGQARESLPSLPEVRIKDANNDTSVATVDMKLEVVAIPVSDVERAKEFYQKVGWRLDVTPPGVVQLTPPGSECSVQFGANSSSAARGAAQGVWLIVSDIQAALDKLAAVGIAMDEILHIGAHGQRAGSRAPELLLVRFVA